MAQLLPTKAAPRVARAMARAGAGRCTTSTTQRVHSSGVSETNPGERSWAEAASLVAITGTPVARASASLTGAPARDGHGDDQAHARHRGTSRT